MRYQLTFTVQIKHKRGANHRKSSGRDRDNMKLGRTQVENEMKWY